MKISIIIPIYNAEKYLHNCIDSILSQNFNDFELLLINDGSTDSSPTICDDYSSKDSRVRVIHNTNQGVTKARKCGVELALGEYIFFVDADDSLPMDSLKNIYQIANDNGADMTVASEKRYLQNNKIITLHNELIGGLDSVNFIEGLLRGACRMGPVAKLIRKTLFGNVNAFNIPSQINQNEDLIMNIFLSANANRILVTKDIVVYNYYDREHSASKITNSQQYWDELFEYIKSILISCDYFDNKKISNALMLYKLYVYSALICRGKCDVDKKDVQQLINAVQSVPYLTYKEQLHLIMLKYHGNANLLRKYYYFVNRISDILFGQSIK